MQHELRQVREGASGRVVGWVCLSPPPRGVACSRLLYPSGNRFRKAHGAVVWDDA